MTLVVTAVTPTDSAVTSNGPQQAAAPGPTVSQSVQLRDEGEDQDVYHYDNNNEDLNKAFEEWEILKASRRLKCEACSHDQIMRGLKGQVQG